MGKFLLVESNREKADMVVVLRGGSYARVLEANRLFKKGYADWIYISKSLSDQNSKILRKYGVELPSGQERLKSILIQLGVPEERILLGHREPGGGTEGDAKRIKAMMINHGFKKGIIVTNWWHTRRTSKICQKIFDGEDIRLLVVVAAKDDISSPSNWWKYRYEALDVLEEFPKLCFLYFNSIFYIPFSDDPKEGLIIQLQ